MKENLRRVMRMTQKKGKLCIDYGIIMLLAGAFMLFVGGPRKDRLVIRPKFSTNHKNDEL